MKSALQHLKLYIKSSYFERGFRLGIGVTVPFILLLFLDYTEYAPALLMGTFLNAPGDVPGSSQRKINTTLVSILIILVVTPLILFTKTYLPLLIGSLAILSFSISLISVYGFRASLVSFSGLLALVLALAIEIKTTQEIWIQIGLMGIGGLWYLLISLVFRRFSPKKEQKQLISETLLLTGQYLKLRGTFEHDKTLQNPLHIQSLALQHQINEKHETLREVLLEGRKRTGHSKFEEKQLLIFIATVNIFELIEAEHIDYKTIRTVFEGQTTCLKAAEEVNITLGNHLIALSEVYINQGTLPDKEQLLQALSKANGSISNVIETIQLPEARESAIVLQNLYDFQEQLFQEITSIRRVLSNSKGSKSDFKKSDAHHFITVQEFGISTLYQHLSLQSTLFRHALRFTIAILLGYSIGYILNLHNSYWILLTIVVIMRPSYGLTKERSKNRIIGTVLGALIATSIILLTQNIVAYLVLATLSLIIAFSLIQQNYKYAAIFITISVLLINSSLYTNVFEVIQYRVIDTLIGTAIAILCNYLLFPSWESNNLKDLLYQALEKNKEYLVATQILYQNQSKLKFNYNLARKEAFLAMSNLNAAFQRLTQDPKSKQKEFQLIYEIVTLNHTMIAAIASIGNFIVTHKTTPASAAFNDSVDQTTTALQDALNILEKNNTRTEKPYNSSANDKLWKKYQQLAQLRDENIKIGNTTLAPQTLHELQEAYLISNQMSWLLSLSDKLKKATKKYYKTL